MIVKWRIYEGNALHCTISRLTRYTLAAMAGLLLGGAAMSAKAQSHPGTRVYTNASPSTVAIQKAKAANPVDTGSANATGTGDNAGASSNGNPNRKPVSAAMARTIAAARPQAEKTSFYSADAAGGKGVRLSAIWVRAAIAAVNDPQRKPTVIVMHSCGGLYSIVQRDKSYMTPRNAMMARELRNAGYNVLLPDSLSARGKRSVCTESLQQREASTAERARDIQGALRWLATQDDVDTDRIALLGWAHGGSAVMKALGNMRSQVRTQKMPLPKAGVAFYPDCAPLAKSALPYKPAAPLLILMGDADDWSPAAACASLTKVKNGVSPITLNVYADSYHEFDAPGMPIQVRMDVPNPQHPGRGVTSGGNSETAIQAYKDTFQFLDAQLGRDPAAGASPEHPAVKAALQAAIPPPAEQYAGPGNTYVYK